MSPSGVRTYFKFGNAGIIVPSKWLETMSSVGVGPQENERSRFSKLRRVPGPSHIADKNFNDELGWGYR